MNAPHPPSGPSPEDERDPTGVRDLLASLPDPGPMPDRVTRSISEALAEEQRQRSGRHANVAPLMPRQDPERPSAERSGGVRWLRPLAAVGAAAAIGIGALAGYQSLSNDTSAPMADAPSATAPADGASEFADRISIRNTGRDYTRTGLSTQAAALTKPAGAAAAKGDDDSPLTTPAGVIACMQNIIGLSIPDRISADLGRYEGKPAVIVVVTDNGKSQAWVVSRTCRNGKGKIAGPTAVT